MPTRATKLLKLLDFCDGGAVLMYRLAGAMGRSDAVRSAGRAINRGAARNMIQKDMKQRRDGQRESWRMLTGCEGSVVTMVKVMGPAFLSGQSRDLRDWQSTSRAQLAKHKHSHIHITIITVHHSHVAVKAHWR